MKTKLIYILIGARRRVGKDTFAAILNEELSNGSDSVAVRKSFAFALREELNAMLGQIPSLRDVDVYTEDATVKEQVTRPLLIALGQAQRFYNPDYWVNQVTEFGDKIKRHYQRLLDETGSTKFHHCFVIVPDWRFPNELARVRAEAYRDNDYVFAIHVDRPGTPPGTPDEVVNEPICARLADWHIMNDGTVDELREKARGTIQNYFMPVINGK